MTTFAITTTMRIKQIIFVLLFGSASLLTVAQPIVLGEEALNKGDYYQAQEFFNQVIEDAAVVQPFELALAYYYRSWTWIKLYGPGPSDITSVMAEPSGEMLINAYNDLISSLSHDDGRLTKRINDLLVQLEPGLMQYGLVAVNRAEDYRAQGKPYAKHAERAVDYLHPAARIKDSYLAYDLLGQAYLLLDQKDKAIEMFEKSVGRYSNMPPETPDFMIGYAFFRLGTLYRDYRNDENLCLDMVRSGKRLLDEQYKQLLSNTPDSPERQRLASEYKKASADLHTLELETLLRSKDKISEAQAVFRNEMSKHPEDVNIMIAYASLFEASDPEVAIEYYGKALEKDPGNPLAEFNLAVVYYNVGQKYFNAGVRAEDEDKQDINIEKALEYFQQARPLFEKILQKSPGDPQAISAMKMICMALDDQACYQYYEGLEGGQ